MIKVGIFFGGPSREREISFAGGRTVYDNLNKSLFEPVPIFVDSHRNFILLDWQYIYKGTIRDFFPPVEALPPSPHHFQIYIESLGKLSPEAQADILKKVGRPVTISELPELIDIAFLALHGIYGEDGQLQGLLESLRIPYTGSGIRACAIGMDKAFQKKMMEAGGFHCPEVLVLDRQEWADTDPAELLEEAQLTLGKRFVIRPANQGSSIGVTILGPGVTVDFFEQCVNRAFFNEHISAAQWQQQTEAERVHYLRELTDIRSGLGFPVEVEGRTIYHPEALLTFLNSYFQAHPKGRLLLESHHTEQQVILEAFIAGKEFSCIVARHPEGYPSALPPTEIIKGSEVFDYRSKYLPGLSRKLTPIDLPESHIHAIRIECERLFDFFEFNTYARIDGFIQEDGRIYLNDPNTTSGMLPSSFFFHQAAEIGLNPSQFLTYILRTSLWERLQTSLEYSSAKALLEHLDTSIQDLKTSGQTRKKIAVLLGGYSFERHISVESGRNIFEKLASSDKYEPIPVFLMGDNDKHRLFQIPINLLLKDNADDIRDKILKHSSHPVVQQIREETEAITRIYASADVVFEPQELSYQELAASVDGVFIALHGRPGEDGQVQRELEKVGLPYNGSGPTSSTITINKYDTLQLLKSEGFTVTDQRLLYKTEWEAAPHPTYEALINQFGLPLIAKPVDDGCSSAVKLIKDRQQLEAYCQAMYREEEMLPETLREALKLSPKEEFPKKDTILFEALIRPEGASHFLEITGGLLTHRDSEGALRFEVFEPSEALASGEVLSLEEKFLAGEGQNITPARFADNASDYAYIAAQVKTTLEKAARLLQVEGYARIDAFVRVFPDKRVETIIIEVNSLPGMTPATCIYHQAAINGYKPYHFIDKILEFGFDERKTDPVLE
ncbi:MAG: D-alanine--D-alanine ligase [Phaeodactylibacter sp.]|nr:D-alanine--D-alanine ligase [Phaeodactylibacter sp.]